MSDQKISELTNITGANLADADEFVVVDVSADQTKAVTREEFFKDTPIIKVGQSGTEGGEIQFADSSGSFSWFADVNGTDAFRIRSSTASNAFNIANSGNVAMSHRLNVAGALNVTGALGVSNAINYNAATGNFYVRSRQYGGIMALGTQTLESSPTTGDLYYPIVMHGANEVTQFNTPTGEAMRITPDGYLALGATSVTGTLATYGTALVIGDSDTGFGQNADGVLDTWANNQKVMTVTATAISLNKNTTVTGNFGIGDASPSEALSVTGNIAATGTVTAGDMFITGPTPTLRLTDNDVANEYTNIQNSGGDTFIDSRNGTVKGQLIFRGFDNAVVQEYARFDANGQLGIGEANPSTALDVNGTVTATAFAGTSVDVGAGYGTGFTLEGNNHQINANDGGGNFNIRVANDYQTGITEAGYASHWVFTQASGLWEFRTTTASQSIGATPVWQVPMSISKEGNIGVLGTVTATSYTEAVFVITGTTPALDPVNGSIQTWTLTAASTPTSSLSSGESMTLMIEDGTAYSITWPTMTWVNNGGAAPTLATSGKTVVALWNVAGNLYGSFVGNGS